MPWLASYLRSLYTSLRSALSRRYWLHHVLHRRHGQSSLAISSMETIDKLRALHEEVCQCWRKYTEPHTSPGEIEVLDLGFLLLEKLVLRSDTHWLNPEESNREVLSSIVKYIRRVKSQFDDDADIKITEVTKDE